MVIDEARPLMQNWADQYGVKIGFWHDWSDADEFRVTVAGFDQNGSLKYNTVIWRTEGFPDHAGP